MNGLEKGLRCKAPAKNFHRGIAYYSCRGWFLSQGWRVEHCGRWGQAAGSFDCPHLFLQHATRTQWKRDKYCSVSKMIA